MKYCNSVRCVTDINTNLVTHLMFSYCFLSNFLSLYLQTRLCPGLCKSFGISTNMRLGDYPDEYNREKHGSYDPARYYGPPDTPFGQVKLGELPGWLLRRRKSPRAMIQAFSRAYWRWNHKYMQPRKCGIAGYWHIIWISMIYGYVINYQKLKHERNYKYH